MKRLLQKTAQRYHYSVILLRELVRTDFKLRYQDSVLGYIWSLLRPLLMFGVLYLVFTVFLPIGRGVPHYPVYLLLGIVLWNFFIEITSGSVSSIVAKGDMLRKINFPKYILILSITFAAVINLLLNFIVVAIFMVFGGVTIGWSAFALIPLIIELYIFSVGLGFLLSALFVKFRDVSYIWEVVTQAGFYATPIIYPLSRIPHHRVQELLMLNPAAQIIQDARHVLITPASSTIASVYHGKIFIWVIPIGVTLIIGVFAGLYFKRRSKYFAEEV